jgi:hypothetical protein
MKRKRGYAVCLLAIVATGMAAVLGGTAGTARAESYPAFVGPLNQTRVLASTVPTVNGDVNPYGVAVVPQSVGSLYRGNVLVSNFNDSGNVQGTGTTIVQVTPSGQQTLFAQINPNLPGCPGGVGLTTALTVLPTGWVIVGSLPTQGGSISGSGCLIVLDSHGTVRETFTGHGINGPWDLASVDLGLTTDLFVTNVLNGTVAGGGNEVFGGTVLRLVITSGTYGMPELLSSTRIGSGFGEETNAAALVIGPTGVGLGPDGTLYVADTLANRIAAIPDALTRFTDDGPGRTVTEGNHVNGPLGLAIAPGGDVLTANGGDGNLVETAPDGAQVAVKTIDTNNGGAGNLFGLAVKPGADAVYFVDDFSNTLNLLF